MKKIINFLRGRVQVRVSGQEKEELMTACARENLAVWSVKSVENRSLRVYVTKRAFPRLYALAERYQCEVEIEEEKGLPIFMWSIRKRRALFLGVALLIVAIGLSTRFILTIDVVGNEQITKEEIVSKLRQHGVNIGTYTKSIDTRRLSNEMLLSMKELSFFSLNIHGMKAEVIVKERAEKPEIVEENDVYDVVATATGQILHMEVLKGQAKHQKGDVVRTGDILISGIHTPEEDLSMESKMPHRAVRAEGRVYAQIRHENLAVIPTDMMVKEKTGKKSTRYALHFLGKRINFYGNGGISFEKYDKISQIQSITLPNDKVLPFHLEKEVIYEYETVAVPMEKETGVEMLKESLLKHVEYLVGEEGDILALEYAVHEENGILQVAQMADCFQQIGKMVPVNYVPKLQLQDSEDTKEPS